MSEQVQDRIEKRVVLRAPVARVWRALTDHREFGQWFRVALEGPFAVGREARGRVLHPGYEHVVWRAVVTAIEPERRFAFEWHPYAVDPAVDYSKEARTLVEFRLEPTDVEGVAGGTLLVVAESGFDKLPAHRRAEAFLRNDGGWAQQVKNIEAYVAGQP